MSPDLNPIEHLWREHKAAVRKSFKNVYYYFIFLTVSSKKCDSNKFTQKDTKGGDIFSHECLVLVLMLNVLLCKALTRTRFFLPHFSNKCISLCVMVTLVVTVPLSLLVPRTWRTRCTLLSRSDARC